MDDVRMDSCLGDDRSRTIRTLAARKWWAKVSNQSYTRKTRMLVRSVAERWKPRSSPIEPSSMSSTAIHLRHEPLFPNRELICLHQRLAFVTNNCSNENQWTLLFTYGRRFFSLDVAQLELISSECSNRRICPFRSWVSSQSTRHRFALLGIWIEQYLRVPSSLSMKFTFVAKISPIKCPATNSERLSSLPIRIFHRAKNLLEYKTAATSNTFGTWIMLHWRSLVYQNDKNTCEGYTTEQNSWETGLFWSL